MANSSAVKRKLGGSTNWLWIKVVATATAGTNITTAVAWTTDWVYSEVWLRASNAHTAAVTITLEWGGVAVENQIILSIPSKTGMYLVAPWLILQNAKTVACFASVANVVSIHWFQNEITEA